MIRAFTGAEIAAMENQLTRIQLYIEWQDYTLTGLKNNPLNSVLQTQRDSMARMQSDIDSNRKYLSQLNDSKDSVIESGDTDKYNNWINFASVIGGDGDKKIYDEQAAFASTGNMVTTVAKDTANDIKNGLPYVGLGIGAVILIVVGAYAFLWHAEGRSGHH